jgi:PAS domain S-box-containing protein
MLRRADGEVTEMPGDRFIELATGQGQRVLDVLFRHASEAVTIQDRSGRLIYANDNAAALIGYPSGQDLISTSGADIVNRFEIIDQSGRLMEAEELPGRRVLAGEAFVEEVVGYRQVGSYQAKWSRVHASPIKNDAGETQMVLNYFLDITDQVRSEEARRILAEVLEQLGSLDIERNLQGLARVLVPQVGGWCAIHLIDRAGLMLVAAAYPETDEAETFVAITGADLIPLDADRLQARVVASGKPQLIRHISAEMIDEAEAREGPEVAELARRLKFHSAVCVPLRVSGRTTGTLTLARSDPDPPFEARDLELMGSVAERAAIAIENARLYAHEHEIAETLQRGLMPRYLPDLPRLGFAARYQPLAEVGHVGGDFYDVVPLADGRCAILVGDIAGKGISAAAAVGLARYTLRSAVRLDDQASSVFTALNDALRQEDPERMCTVAYMLLEDHQETMTVRVALAGHPPPAILRADGGLELVGRPCPPAGVLEAIEPLVEEHSLSPGDMLVAYTDGFSLPGLNPPESLDKELRGCSFDSPTDVVDHLMATLVASEPERPDDVAMIAVQFFGTTGPSAD